MGHYCVVQFTAHLTDIGTEVVDYFKDNSILEAAKYFPQYPFIEACSNRYHLERFPISEFNKENQFVVTDWEHKIKGYEDAIMFLLSYLIKDKVNLHYSDEHMDWKKYIYVVEPITPTIDWYRKFGEPTGIEL